MVRAKRENRPSAGAAGAATTDLAEDARSHRHRHHFGAVTGAELAGDAGEVALDRQRGQAERLADLLVGTAVGHQPQHLDLAARELGDAVLLRAATQAGRQKRGHGRVGVHTAVENPPDTVGDDERGRGLEQVTLRAGNERGTHGVGVIGGGEDDEARPPGSAEVGEQVEAGAVGKADVENTEVTSATGVGAGTRLGDRGCFDDVAGAHRHQSGDHRLANERVVVHDHRGETRAWPRRGNRVFGRRCHHVPPCACIPADCRAGNSLWRGRGCIRSLGSLAVAQIAEPVLHPTLEDVSVAFVPSRSVAPSGGNTRTDTRSRAALPTTDQIAALRLPCRKEPSVSQHHLTTLAAQRRAQRAIAVAAVLGAGAFAVPAGAGGTAGATAPSFRPAALVRAVVVARPGVSLPLAVPGGQVVRTFPHVGSELVRAPMSALRALATDSRVAGVSPDRAGRVAGYSYG